MKTQHVLKFRKLPDGRVAIHTKDYKLFQIEEIDSKIAKLLDGDEVKFVYGYINHKDELHIERTTEKRNW